MEDMHIHLKSGVTDINIMREYIEKCKEKNINKVLLLDHGNRMSNKHIPVLNNPIIIEKFLKNIKKIRKEYPKMDINAGIESDFSYDNDFANKEINLIKNSKFDMVIGSVHGIGKDDYTIYLQANLDMLNTYPIDILGHLKLSKDYEKYNDLIEKIVKLASEKNVMFDINTSDRARWNLQQLEYMLELFKKYKVKYTIGSDAHSVEEIGYEIEETYIKINKILNKEKREIEYTIVSRGTEKYGSKGYMGVTTVKDKQKMLVLSKHFDKYIDTYKDSFILLPEYSIENIAVSRFELMSALAINPFLNVLKDNILITGFGNLGFTNLIYLLKRGYRNIGIVVRKANDFQKETIKELNNEYNSNILFTNDYNNYNAYIEATGSSDVIKNIIENAENNSMIFLLGTPRDEKYFIDPLDINRKNLKIFGGHELNGHTNEERNFTFQKLLNENKNYDFSKYVNIYKSNKNIIKKILEKKENFIEVIKYDI